MTSPTETPVRVAVFERLQRADAAVAALCAAGFPTDRISVVCPEERAHEFAAPVEARAPAGSHAAEGVLGGGAIGAVLGGLAAAVGLTASGGMGLLVVGPLVGASGAGAVAGGLVGAMASRGLEPDLADFYDQEIGRGRVLVAVDTTPAKGVPPAARADEVFAAAGARALDLPRS